MKLIEISTDVSAERFKSVIRDLVSNIYKTNGIIEDMISRGTGDAAKRTANGMNARWFSANYPTLQSSAMALRGVNKNFDVIAKVPVNAFTDSGSKGNGYRITVAAMQGALASIGGRELFDKYRAAYEKQQNLLDGIKEPEAAPAPKAPAALDPKKAVQGSQRDQVEAIVNMTIKNLPDALQHEARAAVNRADNKLVALQQFMNAKGL